MTSKAFLNLTGRLTTPPMSRAVRSDAGYYIRRLQDSEMLSMPISRPVPSIGARCYELRISDRNSTWRLIYRIDEDAIVLACTFKKTTRATPRHRIEESKERLKEYDRATI